MQSERKKSVVNHYYITITLIFFNILPVLQSASPFLQLLNHCCILKVHHDEVHIVCYCTTLLNCYQCFGTFFGIQYPLFDSYYFEPQWCLGYIVVQTLLSIKVTIISHDFMSTNILWLWSRKNLQTVWLIWQTIHSILIMALRYIKYLVNKLQTSLRLPCSGIKKI